LYISAPTAPESGLKTLRAAFAAGSAGGGLRYPSAMQQPLTPAAAYGYEAMSAVLSALQSTGRQANDRAKVITAFDGIHSRSSLIGTYSLNKAGSSSLGASAFAFLRLRSGALVRFTSG
jgi:ABC-type branched-subunit amino acid transport system substrate-binding protein